MTVQWRVLVGDVREKLAELPEASVQCVVTSPPYWGLRDYGVEGQIGLEPTPDAFVASLVEVFQCVWRVLKDDGVVWLNLGDSYSSQTKGDNRTREAKLLASGLNLHRDHSMAQSQHDIIGIRRVESGVKVKDLIGIPWRVAFALQAPQYTGSIKRVEDRIWLAAMLDAEGCMFIHKRKAGQHNGQGYYRQNDSFGPGVEIANTSVAVVERIQALVGKGSICSQGPDQTNGRRRQTIYRWNLRTTESKEFVRELYPHLVAKQQQARILYGCPSSGERAEAAHAALMNLHRNGLSDVDFPEPPTLYRPGWYLRSDVIWSKSNPMPESVTDRPTKSHEYVFLLSKAERYFYDADAIADLALNAGKSVTLGEKSLSRGQANGMNVAASGNGNADVVTVAELRNARTVWTITTQPYPDAHFATFPEALPERCIKAGSRLGDTVLDPFCGSGTTGQVAIQLGRSFIGIELNPVYAELSRTRIGGAAPLFSSEIPA